MPHTEILDESGGESRIMGTDLDTGNLLKVLGFDNLERRKDLSNA